MTFSRCNLLVGNLRIYHVLALWTSVVQALSLLQVEALAVRDAQTLVLDLVNLTAVLAVVNVRRVVDGWFLNHQLIIANLPEATAAKSDYSITKTDKTVPHST